MDVWDSVLRCFDLDASKSVKRLLVLGFYWGLMHFLGNNSYCDR